MKNALRLLAFLFLLLPARAFTQILADEAPGIFRELRDLDGTWFMPTDRGDRLESWSIQDDSTYVGRGMRIKPENGDTVTLETLRLELRDTTITYYAIVRGQNQNKPVPFVMTTADYDGYVFENPAHDDPQKIRYLLLGKREMQVFTEGKRNGRPVKQEFVFEREFTPGSVEFRVKIGANYNTMRKTGFFRSVTNEDKPTFTGKTGWEFGTQTSFKGRGGFITINAELGIVGRYVSATSRFQADTLYARDVTYQSIWLNVALVPEITFRRDGKLSIMAGPYLGVLIGNKTKGTILPEGGGTNKLFNPYNDFNKVDIGLTGGFQYKLNFGKKDIGGIFGVRANLGLSNIDNLYDRNCPTPSLCNGRLSFLGATAYYSVNLLKL
ncbi:MAG: PorT family protein [Saprospiraceae bacterium]|nr:PorT family protein [Saprospiraceae bacterium]